MELPGTAYLFTLATLSMTFVGFCAIVIVFRQTIKGGVRLACRANATLYRDRILGCRIQHAAPVAGFVRLAACRGLAHLQHCHRSGDGELRRSVPKATPSNYCPAGAASAMVANRYRLLARYRRSVGQCRGSAVWNRSGAGRDCRNVDACLRGGHFPPSPDSLLAGLRNAMNICPSRQKAALAFGLPE
jgi:hypothetical protein